MGMNLDNGGHLTHGSPGELSPASNYKIVPYGVDPKTHRIDYDQVRDLAKQCKPKMIIAGASAYPRIIDFKTFRGDRRRGGRLSVGGYGPHCRPGGCRAAPLPRALCRRGDHHHPQDPARVPGAA